MLIVLGCIAVFLLILILVEIHQVRRLIIGLSHQLEYLGARLNSTGDAIFRQRTRWVAKSVTYGDGRVVYYIEPDETPLGEGERR